MSHRGTAGGLGKLCISGRVFSRNSFLISFLAITMSLGILAIPATSQAQDAAATAQDAGQASNPAPQTPQARKKVVLPEGDGKAIAEKSCQACHELTNLTHASKSLEDWRETVQIMVDNGAEIPMDKIDILAQYLAKNFGPKTDASAPDANTSASSTGAPPTSNHHSNAVELPDGDGKVIATNSCQACHKLTNLTDAHMNADDWRATVQLMMDRGAEVPPDKVDTLVQYLAKNFGPKPPAQPK